MFDNLYRWAMRNGSKLLFAAAVILVVLQLLEGFSEIGRFGPENELNANWPMVALRVLSAFSISITPLFGALVINRIDRYLTLRERDSAEA